MRTYAHSWNSRTGSHAYECVALPDGTCRAVWPAWDGPDFIGFYTAGPGERPRPTTRAEWEAYCQVRGVAAWF